MKSYSKVLIIGNPFNRKSGAGITMSNLFKGWPKERIALVSNSNVIAEADGLICENYFQLSYNGKLHPYPLNFVLPRIQEGEIIVSAKSIFEKHIINQGNSKYRKVYTIVRFLLEITGLYNFLYRLKITPELKIWLRNFSPDIIYSQLSTLELIRFVSNIADFTKKPVALHIMDDWPSTINRPGLLYFYWKNIISKEFKSLLNKAAVLMSIGESMSEEYKNRYNKIFIPFHNPIEIDNWLPHSRNDWTIGEKFTILYAGRIGLGMKYSVVDVARVINRIAKKYKNIFFEIQTPDIQELNGIIELSDHVYLVKPLNYSDLPKKFASADLLILPIDFDKASIAYLQFSFQTKISEYMISGTPVLVYAPPETATAKYATDSGWALVVNQQKDELIYDAILKLYFNADLRKDLGLKAKYLAIKNEDSVIVRDKFRESLLLLEK